MRTRQLGFSDLHLTTVALGTWAAGGAWAWGWGPQDDADSIAAIRRGLDLGINWIDTAAIYGVGHSEEVVGEAIQGRRRELLLATKCSRIWDPESGTVLGRLDAQSIRRECEASLRRLRTDVIDLYQIHWPLPDEGIEEGWGAIADLVRQGKVRYGGVSNFSIPQLRRIAPIHPIASLQPPYSMLLRKIESDILPYCATNGIGVIVYSPMQAGLLTGRFSRERVTSLDPGDWRLRNEQFQEPKLSANLALVERLRPIAARAGITLSQLAVAWTLRRSEVTAAIVGARRPAQIEETVLAGDLVLSEEELTQIEGLLADGVRASISPS
jgi:aryl-alcohol dehydrogenase-like predicted oxidoreductase